MGRNPEDTGPLLVAENNDLIPSKKPPLLSMYVAVPNFIASLVSNVVPAKVITGSSCGFSKNAIGEPPMKIRLAARDTMISEFLVKVWAISSRLLPELK
jgi:hypothetical protein